MASELCKEIVLGNWDEAVDIVINKPNLARVWSKNGTLILHDVIAMDAPLPVIARVLQAYPDALTEKEKLNSQLPLHLACANKASFVDVRVVRLLLSYKPEASGEADKCGRTPLHYALENGCSQDIVRYLLRACPGVAQAQDDDGATPLHIACQHGHSTVVIGALLELCPDSCVMCMEDGKTALACVSESDSANKHEVMALLHHYKLGSDRNFRLAAQPSSRRLLV